jgi:hypothetical protein
MFFIFIQVITTLCVATAAAGFSVYGLSQTFNGVFIPVIFMGTALEVGKLVTASFLYRYWNNINWILKTYLSFAVVILIVITSIGIFSFLSKGYQEDTLTLHNNKIKIAQLEAENKLLTDQKNEINKYRAAATNSVINAEKGTKKWMFLSKNAAAKQAHNDITIVENRMSEINKQLAELQQSQIITQLHVGPIIYIAKALHRDVDEATIYLIILLILVFDPLAVALTIGVNVSLKQYNDEKAQNELKLNEAQHIMEHNIHETIQIPKVDELLNDLEQHEQLTDEQIQMKKWLDSVIKKKQLIDDIRYNA